MELTKKITTDIGTYEIKLSVEEGTELGWDILEWKVKDLTTESLLAVGNGVPGLSTGLRKWSLIEQVKKIIERVEADELRRKNKNKDIEEFNDWNGVLV